MAQAAYLNHRPTRFLGLSRRLRWGSIALAFGAGLPLLYVLFGIETKAPQRRTWFQQGSDE